MVQKARLCIQNQGDDTRIQIAILFSSDDIDIPQLTIDQEVKRITRYHHCRGRDVGHCEPAKGTIRLEEEEEDEMGSDK